MVCAGGQLQVGHLLRPGHVGSLADGRDHRVAGDDEFGAFHRHRPAAAGVVRGAQLGVYAFKSHHPVVAGQDPYRCREGGKFDALVPGTLDLFGVGRHLLFGTAIDHGDRLGAQSSGGASGVDGHVAATHHGNPAPGPLSATLVDLP